MPASGFVRLNLETGKGRRLAPAAISVERSAISEIVVPDPMKTAYVRNGSKADFKVQATFSAPHLPPRLARVLLVAPLMQSLTEGI